MIIILLTLLISAAIMFAIANVRSKQILPDLYCHKFIDKCSFLYSRLSSNK